MARSVRPRLFSRALQKVLAVGTISDPGEVRQWHRLAQIFNYHSRRVLHQHGLQANPAAQRVPLRALQRPPRAHLWRWPGTNLEALVQQWRRAEVHPQGRQGLR